MFTLDVSCFCYTKKCLHFEGTPCFVSTVPPSLAFPLTSSHGDPGLKVGLRKRHAHLAAAAEGGGRLWSK